MRRYLHSEGHLRNGSDTMVPNSGGDSCRLRSGDVRETGENICLSECSAGNWN